MGLVFQMLKHMVFVFVELGIEVSASATCIPSRPHVFVYDFAMLTDPTMLDEQLSSVFRAP